MTIDNFAKTLNNPEAITPQQNSELHDIVVQYPWFRTARILASAHSGAIDSVLQLRFLRSPLPEVALKRTPVSVVSPNLSCTMDLIDHFLSAPIGRITASDNTPTDDLSRNSSQDDMDLVSEYLAEIYLKQGLKVKAKEIYARLSLLYPEKSVYFAEIIDRIDQGVKV